MTLTTTLIDCECMAIKQQILEISTVNRGDDPELDLISDLVNRRVARRLQALRSLAVDTGLGCGVTVEDLGTIISKRSERVRLDRW